MCHTLCKRDINLDFPQGITHSDLFDDDIDYNDGMSDMASLGKDDVHADSNSDQLSKQGVAAGLQGKSVPSGLYDV